MVLAPLLVFFACAVGGDPAAGDTGAGADSHDEACADVPTLDWDNFGHGFLVASCQGCHASTATERQGAPEAVVFDTVDDAWRQKEAILRSAAGDAPSMPPRGGVSDDDRTRLKWWLECGTPGA